MNIYKKYMELSLYQKMMITSRLLGLLKTKFYYSLFLKACGNKSIIMKPLYWTPEYISVGSNVYIWPECRIQAIPRYRDQYFNPLIEIQDGVTMEQGCHIASAGHLVIGKNSTLSSYVMIQSVDHQYERIGVDILHQPLKNRETIIGENCFIGAGAKILAGTKLGKQCIVGANSVLKGEYEDFSVIVGSPGRVVKHYNEKTLSWEKIN